MKKQFTALAGLLWVLGIVTGGSSPSLSGSRSAEENSRISSFQAANWSGEGE